LVIENNQVYSLEGSRRRYPISVPAGILRPKKKANSEIVDGAQGKISGAGQLE
jgi:hypothetical protein